VKNQSAYALVDHECVRTFEIKRIHAGDDRYLPRLLNLRRPFYDAGAMDIVHISSRKPPTKFRLRSLAIAAAEVRCLRMHSTLLASPRLLSFRWPGDEKKGDHATNVLLKE